MMKRTTTDKMMRALGTGRTEIMHTKRQLQKWSKAKLIREIIKLEAILLRIAIKLYKSKLPRLRTIRQKALPKHKTKRKTKKIVGETYHTKNGQPYKILASGKARFLKR